MKRILILRHTHVAKDFYQVLLTWLADHHPTLLQYFDIRETDRFPTDLSPYSAAVFWFQDPLATRTPGIIPLLTRFTAACRDHSIAIINDPLKLTETERTRAYAHLTAAGLTVPPHARITDPQEWRKTLHGLTPPLLIREDRGHGGALYRADAEDQARKLEVEFLDRPFAAQIIDTCSPDGLYRKYRYFAAGPRGISHHLVITPHWITRGGDRVFTDITRQEELAYIAKPDPHHDKFQAAIQSIGLDTLAFDYSLLPNGTPIIWEANPFPLIKFGLTTSKYRNHALHRTLAAMTTLYLERAGIEVPPDLLSQASYDTPTAT